LLLELPGDVLLGVQGLLVLPEELLLFGWNSEREQVSKNETDKQTKAKQPENDSTVKLAELALEGLNGGFRNGYYEKIRKC
jgi:hypothetical protein